MISNFIYEKKKGDLVDKHFPGTNPLCQNLIYQKWYVLSSYEN